MGRILDPKTTSAHCTFILECRVYWDLRIYIKLFLIIIGACEVIQQEQGSIYEYILPLEHGIVLGTVYKETLAYLEEAMAQLKSATMILRLMCLLSLCNNGISSGDYERLKHQFLQAYGFDKLMTFHILKKMGLLTSREALVALKASVQGNDHWISPPLIFFHKTIKKDYWLF